MRIGHGYDVHKLKEGRKLILGGVTIPHTKGLDGHSDADVLTHAVMDSLIGALALGDIGKLFPDTDNTYKDANSIKLLEKTFDIIKNNGYKIGNIDCTIIAQKPKVSGYTLRMRETLAKALETTIDHISVKATTEEHLGFTGNEEGISAHCVCLLEEI